MSKVQGTCHWRKLLKLSFIHTCSFPHIVKNYAHITHFLLDFTLLFSRSVGNQSSVSQTCLCILFLFIFHKKKSFFICSKAFYYLRFFILTCTRYPFHLLSFPSSLFSFQENLTTIHSLSLTLSHFQESLLNLF